MACLILCTFLTAFQTDQIPSRQLVIVCDAQSLQIAEFISSYGPLFHQLQTLPPIPIRFLTDKRVFIPNHLPPVI